MCVFTWAELAKLLAARGFRSGAGWCREVLSYIRTKPFGPSGRVALTCHKENQPALSLYENLGFRPTGVADEDELEYAMNVDTPSGC